VFDTLILTLLWTFNIAAIVLASSSDVLKKVVINSSDLLVILALAQVLWSLWIFFAGAPMLVTMAAIWLGVNLLLTVGAVRRHAARLSSGQIVLVCAWWIGLLAMLLRAWRSAGTSPWA